MITQICFEVCIFTVYIFMNWKKGTRLSHTNRVFHITKITLRKISHFLLERNCAEKSVVQGMLYSYMRICSNALSYFT